MRNTEKEIKDKTKKRGKRIMWTILACILALIIAAAVFFSVPFSAVRAEFERTVNDRITVSGNTAVFTEEDIKDLPLPVQNYFRYCGYLGTPKMSYMKAVFKGIDFMMSETRTLKINYVQYDFVKKPERFAYISSSLFGIPFEGLDSYGNGTGGMKGTLAKMFTLFDQRGDSMNKASLVTILSEALVAPNIALQSYITWKAIDDTHAKATISYYGISASGIFTFDENGEMLSFTTSDRTATDMDGSERQADWSALTGDYQVDNGIKKPKILQAVWHFPEGDRVYFNANKAEVNIEFYY